jgi:methyltransferase (TIGR00027 family)
MAERALHPSRALPLLKQRWFWPVVRLVERLTIPGIILHYALRKRCIYSAALESVRKGVTQLVVLGAGFDALGADLQAAFPSLTVWEIDHPATQELKTTALQTAEPTALHLVPADLSKRDLAGILSNQSEFGVHQSTLWVAEGLLMYFDEAVVRRIFKQAAEMSGSNSGFIFTFMRPDSDDRLRFDHQTKLIDWWLARSGEPFRWGIAPDRLIEFVRPWRPSRVYDAEDLPMDIADPIAPVVAKGEVICVAEL